MLDALNTLLENNVISESVRQEIQEAWEEKIKENRLQVTATLREEFAQKYEHDKTVMVEAIDEMVSERLAAEMAELAEDRRQLIDAKAKYVKKVHESSSVLKGFVQDVLKKEVTELHSDQRDMAKKFRMLEEFVVDSLAHELTEFQTDKRDLANTKVRLVREAKERFAGIKKSFVKENAEKVQGIVKRVLTKEIGQLKEDIETARKNDFGRRLFEAFSSEYMNSYLNEKSETSKLMKVVDIKDKQLTEAKVLISKQQKVLSAKDKKIQNIQESVERDKTISSLVEPLSKSQKSVMIDLLESVQTNRLQQSFDRYLPTVLDDKKVNNTQKATLTEGKEITGNKVETQTTGARDNVIDIRRLAGIN
jgi:adenosyl cobinamide kinase/adenosyl cobinamide phosphate guanylyltransferase